MALNWRSPKWPHLSFKISKVEMHENYDTKVLENDIAMVTIDGTFNFESKYLAPIKLAPSSIDHLPGKSGQPFINFCSSNIKCQTGQCVPCLVGEG